MVAFFSYSIMTQEQKTEEKVLSSNSRALPFLLEAHCDACNTPNAEFSLIGTQRGYKRPDMHLYNCVECGTTKVHDGLVIASSNSKDYSK